MQQSLLDLNLTTNVLEDKTIVDVCLFPFKNAVFCKVPIFERFSALCANRPSNY